MKKSFFFGLAIALFAVLGCGTVKAQSITSFTTNPPEAANYGEGTVDDVFFMLQLNGGEVGFSRGGYRYIAEVYKGDETYCPEGDFLSSPVWTPGTECGDLAWENGDYTVKFKLFNGGVPVQTVEDLFCTFTIIGNEGGNTPTTNKYQLYFKDFADYVYSADGSMTSFAKREDISLKMGLKVEGQETAFSTNGYGYYAEVEHSGWMFAEDYEYYHYTQNWTITDNAASPDRVWSAGTYDITFYLLYNGSNVRDERDRMVTLRCLLTLTQGEGSGSLTLTPPTDLKIKSLQPENDRVVFTWKGQTNCNYQIHIGGDYDESKLIVQEAYTANNGTIEWTWNGADVLTQGGTYDWKVRATTGDFGEVTDANSSQWVDGPEFTYGEGTTDDHIKLTFVGFENGRDDYGNTCPVKTFDTPRPVIEFALTNATAGVDCKLKVELTSTATNHTFWEGFIERTTYTADFNVPKGTYQVMVYLYDMEDNPLTYTEMQETWQGDSIVLVPQTNNYVFNAQITVTVESEIEEDPNAPPALTVASPMMREVPYAGAVMYDKRPAFYTDQPAFKLALTRDAVIGTEDNNYCVLVKMTSPQKTLSPTSYFLDTIRTATRLANYVLPKGFAEQIQGPGGADRTYPGDTLYQTEFQLVHVNNGKFTPMGAALKTDFYAYKKEPSFNTLVPNTFSLLSGLFRFEASVKNGWPGYSEGNVWLKVSLKKNGEAELDTVIKPIGEPTGSFGLTNSILESFTLPVSKGNYTADFTILRVQADGSTRELADSKRSLNFSVGDIVEIPELVKDEPYTDDPFLPMIYYGDITASLHLAGNKHLGSEENDYAVLVYYMRPALAYAGSDFATYIDTLKSDADLKNFASTHKAFGTTGQGVDAIYQIYYQVGVNSADNGFTPLTENADVIYRFVQLDANIKPTIKNFEDITLDLRQSDQTTYSFEYPTAGRNIDNVILGINSGCTQIAIEITNEAGTYSYRDTCAGEQYCIPKRIADGTYKLKMHLLKVNADGKLSRWDNTDYEYNLYLGDKDAEYKAPVEEPTFTPRQDIIYQDSVVVTLECATEGVTIMYIVGNNAFNEPTEIYTEPIVLRDSAYIRAQAHKDGLVSSPVVTAFYRVAPKEIVLGPCEAVSDNSITRWGSYKVSAREFAFNQNAPYVRWEEGDACLFMLTEKETLAPEDMPQDGTLYSDLATLGSGRIVIGSTTDEMRRFEYSSAIPSRFTNLTPNTQYYIHAFPYISLCEGTPLYVRENIPVMSFTTALEAPTALSVNTDATTATSLSAKVNTTQPYVLVYGTAPLAANEILLKNGTAYGEGAEIFSAAGAAYKIAAFNSKADSVQINGLQPSTPYYLYAFSCLAEDKLYSDEYAFSAAATVYPLPADLELAAPATVWYGNTAPVGWELDEANTHSVLLTHNSRYGLSIAVPQYSDKDEASCNTVYSPVLDAAGYEKALVSFRVYYYGQGAFELGGETYTQPDATDSITVQYRALNQTAWTTIDRIAATHFDDNGLLDYESPEFNVSGLFRMRFVCSSLHQVPPMGGAIPYAAFCNIKAEPALSCKPVKNLQQLSDQTTDRKAVLSWEYGTENTVRQFLVNYRESAATAYTTLAVSGKLTAELTALTSGTDYVAQVQAVCGEGDSSLSRRINFHTLVSLPYIFEKQCNGNRCTMPAHITQSAGYLPAEGLTEFTAVPAHMDRWDLIEEPGTGERYPGLADMTANKTQNPLWLRFPGIYTGERRDTLTLILDMAAWRKNMTTGIVNESAFEDSRCLLLVSEDGTFAGSTTAYPVNMTKLGREGFRLSIAHPNTADYLYAALYTELNLPVVIDDDGIYTGEAHSLMIKSFKVKTQACEAVTDLRHYNVQQNSIDLSWKGDGEWFGVFYKDRTAAADSEHMFYTRATSCTLTDLTPGTAYQYYVVTYCSEDRSERGPVSETRYFSTVENCTAPVIEVLGYSYDYATLAMHGTNKIRQVYFEVVGYEDLLHGYLDFTTDTVDLIDLDALGNGLTFRVKARAICSAVDTSPWSNTVEFTALPIPVCGDPTNLQSKVDAENLTATLSWKAGQNNIFYMVEIKKAGATRYDTAGTEALSYEVWDIEPNVVYSWRLTGYCGSTLTGKTVNGPDFGTNVSRESVAEFSRLLTVSEVDDRIMVGNPYHTYIKQLQIFSVNGSLLHNFNVETTDNLMLRHNLTSGLALIRITGSNGKIATFKLMIR